MNLQSSVFALKFTEYKIKNGIIIKRHSKESNNSTGLPTASNLKSNIFDKMLSEEMLAIKQHFHEKDSSHTPSIQITSKNNVATPTLEVKQRWPIQNWHFKSSSNADKSELILNDESEKEHLNLSNKISNQHNDNHRNCNNTCNSRSKDKILELRSLPENSEMKTCGCMKTNPHSTCSQLCTGKNDVKGNRICTHQNYPNMKHECTRTTSSKLTYLSYPVYPIYVTYPSYLYGISTYTVNPYYHPDPIDEIKISKTKRRRKYKKPVTIFIDEDQEEIAQDDDEDSLAYYENSIEVYDADLIKMSRRKSTRLPNIVTNVENDDDQVLGSTPKRNTFLINRDVFVNNIVDDLKKHYNDVVIKDCYCSLSARSYVLNIFSFQVLICVYLLIYF
ncbi:uncharacterized protein [Epargyreus clarus]|uniref:uncharacterized protein n=1 Tax=Epargyreus clarus TaxID=520877 RepID=UPI003C2FC650